jgi:hypothetical protein
METYSKLVGVQINTMSDLRQYCGSILENYDPYTWESVDMCFDEYVDCVSRELLAFIRERDCFCWGDEMEYIWGSESNEILNRVEN